MTELQYLKDTYLFIGLWNVVDKWENEFGKYIILDQTIFYPQWGWQPSDTGIISTLSGIFQVEKVRLDEQGIVYHFGLMMSGDIRIGDIVSLQVDSERRIWNARNHSAGHLIDIAMKEIWLSGLQAMKWYHFPEGSYVEYEWLISEKEEVIIDQLNNALKWLCDKKISMVVEYDISGVIAPNGKLPRSVHFEWFNGCGCGGTHVRNTGEIGTIHVKKMKNKGGAIRVSYEVM